MIIDAKIIDIKGEVPTPFSLLLLTLQTILSGPHYIFERPIKEIL